MAVARVGGVPRYRTCGEGRPGGIPGDCVVNVRLAVNGQEQPATIRAVGCLEAGPDLAQTGTFDPIAQIQGPERYTPIGWEDP